MNKHEFLSELKQKLKRMPQSEIDNAVRYYEEYFDDAGVVNEQRVIEELISPSAVASKIIGEYAVNNAEENIKEAIIKHEKKRTNPLLIVILAVFASPIALPIGIAIVVIIFAAIISILAVLFAFAVSGAAFVLSSIVVAGAGIFTLFKHFATGLFFLGVGFFTFPFGIALTIGMFKLTKLVFFGMQKALGKLLIRKGAK